MGQMQINEDAGIGNLIDKITSRVIHNLSAATRRTFRSNDIIQRLCGALWPRKMVRLITHILDQTVLVLRQILGAHIHETQGLLEQKPGREEMVKKIFKICF